MQIHEGFPADTVVGPDGSKKDFLMRFDPQSLQMPDDYYDAISTRRTKIASSPPTYRFSFDVAQVAGKVGDYVAVNHLFKVAAKIGVLSVRQAMERTVQKFDRTPTQHSMAAVHYAQTCIISLKGHYVRLSDDACR